jgi:hypothetical protein
MDDVTVHYNSDKPAAVDALAFTQGIEIHLAPGQEKHLPHEAWHVVQQKQGRVQPTMQAEGVAINDDSSLEREADMKGEKALQITRRNKAATEGHELSFLSPKVGNRSVVQRSSTRTLVRHNS